MRDYETRGGKEMFVPKDLKRLLSALNLHSVRVEHIMAEESRLHFDSPDGAQEAYRTLSGVETNTNRAVFKMRGFDGRSMIIGCDLFASEVDADTRMQIGTLSIPFNDYFVRMPTTTSAKHHPDGIFWLAAPRVPASQSTTRLPLTEVRGKFEQALDIAPNALAA
jgi:hypothetical protein